MDNVREEKVTIKNDVYTIRITSTAYYNENFELLLMKEEGSTPEIDMKISFKYLFSIFSKSDTSLIDILMNEAKNWIEGINQRLEEK